MRLMDEADGDRMDVDVDGWNGRAVAREALRVCPC
jgi:hypothetical protein